MPNWHLKKPIVAAQTIEAAAWAIIQADYRECPSLTSRDFPGIKAIYDGRSMLDQDLWSDIRYLRIGVG